MRIAIVEDEATVARHLERAVRAALAEGAQEIAILPTFTAALDHMRSQSPDLVFLDLNLNGRDGFGLLGEAVASRFQTIVVSAHEEQAIRAFEYGVADFVPKPWTEGRLRLAIERALGRRDPEVGQAALLAVRRAGVVELVELRRVHALRGADDYAEVVLDDGSTRLHAKTLAALARTLPGQFTRTHRSWIVNLDHVRGWAPAPGGRALLMLGRGSVPVGRTYRAAVVARLAARSD